MRLRVSLDDVNSEPAATELSVTNTAPTSVVTGSLTATVAEPFTLKVGADDPSAADMAAQFSYSVDWGDGSPLLTVVGPADPPVTHIYTTAGDYQATVTATDKDGGTGPGTQVTVSVQTADHPNHNDGDNGGADTNNGDSDTTSTGTDLAATGSTVGLGPILIGFALLVSGTGLLMASRHSRGAGSWLRRTGRASDDLSGSATSEWGLVGAPIPPTIVAVTPRIGRLARTRLGRGFRGCVAALAQKW